VFALDLQNTRKIAYAVMMERARVRAAKPFITKRSKPGSTAVNSHKHYPITHAHLISPLTRAGLLSAIILLLKTMI
jgi:hypothetical protein